MLGGRSLFESGGSRMIRRVRFHNDSLHEGTGWPYPGPFQQGQNRGFVAGGESLNATVPTIPDPT